MNRKVYISRLSSFLPNAPVVNDEMENQIKQRHYAMREGNLTHTNAELMVNAINGLFDNEFDANAIELLACGTSTPDQLIPSHASMVHGLLKGSNPIPLLSVSGVCCSAVQALEFAFLSVLSGHTSNAVCGGSELVSPLLRSDMFEEEYRTINQIQENPYIAFEKDFLRWMLSDGAGCVLLTDKPLGKMSLEIKWIESVLNRKTEQDKPGNKYHRRIGKGILYFQ